MLPLHTTIDSAESTVHQMQTKNQRKYQMPPKTPSWVETHTRRREDFPYQKTPTHLRECNAYVEHLFLPSPLLQVWVEIGMRNGDSRGSQESDVQ